MSAFVKRLAGALLATVAISGGASAQYYGNDLACRQYADQAIVPLQQQAAGSAVGSTVVGAGLGAALGAAIGGGRGAGIGAATGAIAGTGAGVANAQVSNANIEQWRAYYYQQCMAQSAPQPQQQAPAYGYQPQPYGYQPQPYGYR
jgi:uncharacterized protein YcfJ